MGMRLGSEARRAEGAATCSKLLAAAARRPARAGASGANTQDDDAAIRAQRERVADLKKALRGLSWTTPMSVHLLALADDFVRKTCG